MSCAIASSRESFDMAPASFRGYVEKKLKRRLDLIIESELYSFNQHGIVIKRTPQADGQVWYSHASLSHVGLGSLRAEMDWVKSYAVGKDHLGLFFK
jgi:hypothetical protein